MIAVELLRTPDALYTEGRSSDQEDNPPVPHVTVYMLTYHGCAYLDDAVALRGIAARLQRWDGFANARDEARLRAGRPDDACPSGER